MDFYCVTLLARCNSLTLRDIGLRRSFKHCLAYKILKYEFFQNFSMAGDLLIVSVRSPSKPYDLWPMTYIAFNRWVTHTEANYGGLPRVFPQNTFYCRSDYDVVSVRNVGHPTDTSISTISLFEPMSMKGNTSQYTSNVPNFRGTFSSFVITPLGEATFYGAPYYEGLSICLKPRIGYITHFTIAVNELGFEPGDIKSMKFGCHSTNIAYSSPSSDFAVKQ